MDDITEAISALATQIDERFEQVDRRFDQVDRRFDQVDQRFDRLEGRVGGIEAAQQETNRRLASIEGRLEALENDVKELYIMVGKSTVELKELNGKTSKEKIELLHDYLTQLAKQEGIELHK
jgi:chromosome segregation ATPase